MPTTILDIDLVCGNEGAGGEQSEQNVAKNNFCASGTAIEISIKDMERLQKSVEQDPSISFGPAISTTNRAALQTLGEGKLVTLKAFIIRARQEGRESVNCKDDVPDSPAFHDIHITLVDPQNRREPSDSHASLAAKECTGLVVEMSPHHRPEQWTVDNINELAEAQALVRVTGQQFFDSSHRPCENGEPVGNSPRRISLWEIHPVYEFEVCIANCAKAGQWLPLGQWVQLNHGGNPVVIKRTDPGANMGLPSRERPGTSHRLTRSRKRSPRD